MADPAPAGPGASANAADPPGPPKKGYAVRYERLLMEELSLKKSRDEFLNPPERRDGASRVGDSDGRRLQELKIRGMIHRASLEGMLIAAQQAADDCGAGRGVGYEAGLDRPEAKNALAALWTTKSRQLEEDDNRLPHFISSDSLERRKRFSSDMNVGGSDGVSASNQPPMLEASADDFFSEFPECRRRDDASWDSECDDSENDDDDSIENQKPAAKKKREVQTSKSNDEALLVTCSSSSPSPERSKEEMITNESNAATRYGMKNKQGLRHNSYQKQNLPVNNSSSSANWGNQHTPNGNPNQSISANQPIHKHSQRQQRNHISGTYPNNPYQGKQRGQQQNHWQNNHQRDSYKNPTSAFDYNESNSRHMSFQSKPAAKNNHFCTAKELGPNFNDKPRGGEGGLRDGDDDWDNRGSNGHVYSGTNNNYQRKGVGMNYKSTSSATGRPQQMVAAALRGPKTNLSQGLQNKFQTPMVRQGGNGKGQPSSNCNDKNFNSTNRQAGGGTRSGGPSAKDDDDLPEELKGLDKELIEKINNEIVDNGQKVRFEDIAGLEHAKKAVYESVILPMKRPQFFTGLRAAPKGMLLFGPPGTGA